MTIILRVNVSIKVKVLAKKRSRVVWLRFCLPNLLALLAETEIYGQNKNQYHYYIDIIIKVLIPLLRVDYSKLFMMRTFARSSPVHE